jgi:hypothetical protein
LLARVPARLFFVRRLAATTLILCLPAIARLASPVKTGLCTLNVGRVLLPALKPAIDPTLAHPKLLADLRDREEFKAFTL